MTETLAITEICPTTTQAWVQQGATLVDVREPHEVAQLAFDVPKLVHIPLSEFEDRFEELPKDQPLVMVCQVGARSLRAAAYLIYHGWDADKVVNMKYGMARWAQKGFPVHGDTETVATGGSGCGCGGGNVTPSNDAAACCANTADASAGQCC